MRPKRGKTEPLNDGIKLFTTNSGDYRLIMVVLGQGNDMKIDASRTTLGNPMGWTWKRIEKFGYPCVRVICRSFLYRTLHNA